MRALAGKAEATDETGNKPHAEISISPPPPSTAFPRIGRDAALAGRVWRPELGGPSVVAIRADGVVDITASFATMRDLCEERTLPWRLRQRQGRAARRACGDPRQHAARAARRRKALAPRADRPAGDQGGGRHLRHLDARARDRGAGARQPGGRGRHPRRDRAPRRRGFRQAQAGLAARPRTSRRCSSPKAPGANISRSASARTRRSSPSRSRFRRSAPSWTPASIRAPPGTTPSPRSCSR